MHTALFSISLLNSDNPQAGGISQGTKPNLSAAQSKFNRTSESILFLPVVSDSEEQKHLNLT